MEKPSKQDSSEEAQFRKLKLFVTLNTNTVLKWRDHLLTIQENEWYRFDGFDSMGAWAKKYLPNLKPDTIRQALWREKRKRLKAPTKDVIPCDIVTPPTTVTTTTSGNGEVKLKQIDILLDQTGRKIPRKFEERFLVQNKIDEIAKQLNQLKNLILKNREQGIAPYDQINVDYAETLAKLVRRLMYEVKLPYLCMQCQGSIAITGKECGECHNWGLMSAKYYKEYIDKNSKDINERARLSNRVSQPNP
jgi:hypothetical protein